jgi:hypothetical protein
MGWTVNEILSTPWFQRAAAKALAGEPRACERGQKEDAALE